MNDQNQIHDEQQITLRCSKCNRPITPQEAVQTPTGYRCPDCVRKQQKIFDTSQPIDFILGFILAGVLSFIGSLITSLIGFFTLLLAPAAGVVIAEVIRAVIKKRRSQRLFRLVSAGIILGGLPLIGINLLRVFAWLNTGSINLFSLLPLGYQVIYLVMAVPSAYYRLSGKRKI